MNRTFALILLTALAAGLFWSCARIGLPPGGPEDKTGPKVVESFPVNDSTNVPRKLVARLVFSKPVNHASVEAALYMSPDPRQRLRYHWHGNTLDLIYLDSLDANRTYVISVGSQAKDLRGNPAGATSTVAFSTGSHIDRGRIDGWIGEMASPQSVSIWAYRLRGDTLPNPVSDDADYRLQVGSDFTFRLDHLFAARYRLFAVTDRNFDGFWNPPAELLGIPPWDITVSDSTRDWISFRLSMQDSAAVRIRAAREANDREVDVRTARAVPELRATFISPVGDSVLQMDAFPDSAGSEVWRVFPAQRLSAGLWRVNARGIDDYHRSWLDSVDSLEIRERADTSHPHLAYSEPRARSLLRFVPDTLQLTFDKPLNPDSLSAAGFRLKAAGDTDSVLVKLNWPSRHVLDLIPESRLSAGKRYTLRYDGRRIRDYSDHTLSDTTADITFTIYAPDSLGTLVGELSTTVKADYIYDVLAFKNHTRVASSVAPGPGSFQVELLPTGKYLLEVIRDVNRDSVFTYGRMWPFEYSEPFLFSPDTLSIRARWEYETRINWQDNP